MAAHPGLLKETQYRMIVHEEVWELKHAYRETCMCRICFNLRCYREALNVLYKILLVLAQRDDDAPDELDAADEANLQELPGARTAADPKLQKLIVFCESSPGRRGKVTELICADCFNDADAKCIRQECPDCPSFHRMWSAPTTGLRGDLVDSHGRLKTGISPVWSQQLQWSRIKSGGDGSNKEDDLRQKREGTLIQLLDEFEPVQKLNVRHQFHIEQSRAAEGDFSRNSIPGMIDDKSDYSENGSLEKPKQLQQEYWVIVYYTLLISIASFLVSDVWRERESILPIGAEVTVEPADYEPLADGRIEAVEGSFWARVEILLDAAGNAVEYVEGADVDYIVRHESREMDSFSLGFCVSMVKRSRLRHSKRHRIAFLQITNDKKHDLWSSSAFATKRQEFFQKWQESGRAAAIEWARNDRAESARKDATTAAADAAVAATSAAAATAAAAAANGADISDPKVKAVADIAAAVRRLLPTASLPRPRLPPKRQPTEAEFAEWLLKLEQEKFWAWLEDTDNATHFKSKEMLSYWSTRMDAVEFIKIVWVEFGCPGHGKGPWDGLGAMVKTKVARDLTNGQALTPSGDISDALEVAQHARATFCTPEWLREHAYLEINEIVVMYLDTSEIVRPAAPDDVSPVNGILSHYSFMMLSRYVYAMREWSCWCPACSRVRGRGPGLGTVSDGHLLRVPDCTHKKLTVWREGQFVISKSVGPANRKKRLAELWAELEPTIKPGKYGCVQVRELWGQGEERHYRPGHHWLFEFGDAGDGMCVDKVFSGMPHRSFQVYKGMRFYNGEKALCVKRWLNRIDADSSGLAFEDWDPSAEDLDPNAQPAFMIVNSSEVRGVATLGRGAKAELQEVLPAPLQAVPVANEGVSSRTRLAAAVVLTASSVVGPSSYALRPDIDNKWRERCE